MIYHSFRWAEDGWLQHDKLDHFFGSALLFAVIWLIFFRFACREIGIGTFLLTVFFGYIWELKDAFFANGFSAKDLILDILGALSMWSLLKITLTSII